MGKKNVSSVLDRLQAVFGVSTDNQLGEALGVNRSTLGNWRSRDSVPYTICVDIAQARGVSLDWLLLGTGVPTTIEVESYSGASNEAEALILRLWRNLDDDGKKALQVAAEEKVRMKVLERRLEDLEAVVPSLKTLA